MDNRHLRELLKGVAEGTVSTEDAEKALKTLPFEDLNFVNIDNHRSLRTGYPEVVFCQGKTAEQVGVIMSRLAETSNSVLGTRATREQYEVVLEELNKNFGKDSCIACGEAEKLCTVPQAYYYETARVIVILKDKDELERQKETRKTIAVVTAGTADIPVAEEAAITAETLETTLTESMTWEWQEFTDCLRILKE